MGRKRSRAEIDQVEKPQAFQGEKFYVLANKSKRQGNRQEKTSDPVRSFPANFVIPRKRPWSEVGRVEKTLPWKGLYTYDPEQKTLWEKFPELAPKSMQEAKNLTTAKKPAPAADEAHRKGNRAATVESKQLIKVKPVDEESVDFKLKAETSLDDQYYYRGTKTYSDWYPGPLTWFHAEIKPGFEAEVGAEDKADVHFHSSIPAHIEVEVDADVPPASGTQAEPAAAEVKFDVSVIMYGPDPGPFVSPLEPYHWAFFLRRVGHEHGDILHVLPRRGEPPGYRYEHRCQVSMYANNPAGRAKLDSVDLAALRQIIHIIDRVPPYLPVDGGICSQQWVIAALKRMRAVGLFRPGIEDFFYRWAGDLIHWAAEREGGTWWTDMQGSGGPE